MFRGERIAGVRMGVAREAREDGRRGWPQLRARTVQ